MNFYQQPFGMPYMQGMYQQPVYPQFIQWGSKVFKGVLQAAGKDHIILKDVNSDTRYLLLTIYLCYVTFDEKIEYDYPFQNK